MQNESNNKKNLSNHGKAKGEKMLHYVLSPVWLTQAQMALLFNTTKQNVSLHINNIFKEGENFPAHLRRAKFVLRAQSYTPRQAAGLPHFKLSPLSVYCFRRIARQRCAGVRRKEHDAVPIRRPEACGECCIRLNIRPVCLYVVKFNN